MTMRIVLALALATATPAATAAIWGYIDAAGVAHVATEKQDERYQLFFKGASSADVAARAAIVDGGGSDEFKRTAIYRRVADHPNIKRFQPLIVANAEAMGLDPALVKAVIAVESAFEPDAISAKGALGLMQVIPDTGARYGVAADRKRTLEQKLLDPATNVRIGARYLRDLLVLFAGSLPLALAAYNAGEGAVQRYDNRIPPFPETQEYVKLVQEFLALYQPPMPAQSPAAKAPARIRVPSARR